jgi:hypothetical protein
MRRAALAPLLLVAMALAGCVSLPEEGPVNSAPQEEAAPAAGSFDYNPEGPKPDDQPAAIVNGFVDALRQTPLTFSAAWSFMTDDAPSEWEPGQRTIVYDDGSLETDVNGSFATVSLGSSVQLDSRGSWLGDPTGGQGVTFDLHLTQEEDGWRIIDPPDALIIPRSHFDTRFVRYDLHYFDPSARLLVPEPVYVPAGAGAPSLLVSALLSGPEARLRSVERTFFPAGTRLERSVSVEDGIADVPLSSELLETDPGQLDLAMAQLAWTLRELPGVDRMRVTVNDTAVDGRTGASARSLLGWSTYDPAVGTARPDLFGTRDGDVVAFPDDEAAPVSTAFRSDRVRSPVRSLAVSLGQEPDDVYVAAVTSNGRRALTSVLPPVAGTGERATTAYTGSDLLRPAYDVFDHLWLVDRIRSRARVVVVDGRVRTLRVPGITGGNVTAFEVSRDGTRLAAVVDGALVVSRISRSEAGRPTRVHRASAVPLPEGVTGHVVDVAWATPATLAMLVRPAPDISQVAFASVDGSYALAAEVTSLEPLFERADDLITAPVADAPVLLQGPGGRVYRVSPTGHWTVSSPFSGIQSPTYAG